jgi:flavin reductase (DIM6/NTAB) family NADH-FMN oxidoreductase RutF
MLTPYTGTVSGERMRTLFGSVPTPVFVVTALDAAGRPCGCTCNAVSAVSLDPPSLLVSLGHHSRTLAAVTVAGAFAVNFLAADGEAVARRFATSVPDKFAGVPHQVVGVDVAAPVLGAGVAGWAVCRVARVVDVADHSVVFGDVVHVMSGGGPTLLAFRRAYLPAPPAGGA